ncbi:MAG: tetratricopeptide repeat protein [Neptuniibacter sp.]
MSLVNDMLRDLEQRNQKGDSVSGGAEPLRAAQVVDVEQPNSRISIRIALWIVGIASLAVTFWLLFDDQQNKAATHSQNTLHSPTEVLSTSSAKVPEPEVKKQADKDQKLVSIASVKWAGTSAGGDLVVRLDGEADIQLLGQDSRSVHIAFENVMLETSLPEIDSPLIESIDMFRDRTRTELMLTATNESRFAFRVQHSPVTMILGIIPLEKVLPIAEEETVETVTHRKPIEKKAVAVASTVSVAETKKQDGDSRTVKPVTKSKQVVSDQQAVAQARSLVSKIELQKAIKVLEKRIAQAPDKSAQTRGYLVTVQLSSGLREAAERLLLESLRIHPHDLTLRKLQARVLLSERKVVETLQLLESSKPAVEKDPEYYELLATAYQQGEQYPQAAKIYYQLLQYQNGTPRWWVGMGYSLELDKRYAEALRAYQSATQIPGITASLKTYAEQRVQALTGR